MPNCMLHQPCVLLHCSESSCETVDIWGVTGPRIIAAEFLFVTLFSHVAQLEHVDMYSLQPVVSF